MKNIFVEDLGNGVILEMAAIPGGTFIMGSPPEELGHQKLKVPNILSQSNPSLWVNTKSLKHNGDL